MEETIKEGGADFHYSHPNSKKQEAGNSWGNTYTLLCDGLSQTQIAKRQQLSLKTIWKRTHFYLDTYKIEKIAWGVYRKTTKKDYYPPLKPLAIITTLPTMLPHKFGAVFAQVGKPNLPYDSYGKAKEKTPLYYAQFGKHKTQIWLYAGFEGTTPDELIASGRRKLDAIAQELSLKYHITITLLRFYTDMEWVDISKERSKATAKEAGMKKKQRVEVADAIHVLDGTSHNDLLEIDKAPGKDGTIPTEHARIRHALYSGEYEQRFMALLERDERAMTLIEKLLDGQVAIRARMEMEAKE